MQAAFIKQTGSPDVIEWGSFPDPIAEEGEVLVKISAVSVNPIDTYIRAGAIPMPVPMPYILGCDLAGVVQEVGPGVTRFQPGDRVWGSNQGILGRQGTFAEYAAVKEEWIYPIPTGISDEQAAAGALVGITAGLGLFQHTKLQAGELLFVNGGSGGVGSAVLQFAKTLGARVITTAGSDEKLEYCRQQGADLVLDHRAEDLDEQLKSYLQEQGNIDIWWETLREPNLERTIPLMAKRGRIVVMAGRDAVLSVPLGAFYPQDLSLIGFAMFNASPEEQQAVADKINLMYSSEAFRPLIGQVLPLSQAAEAHRLQEEKTLQKTSPLSGKIVLKV